MPNLPYIGCISTHSFNASNRKFHDSASEFLMQVPQNAIPEDMSVTIKFGSCSHGPFLLPENCYVITGFYCVVATSNFSLPVRVTLQHCMELTEYKRTSEIMVMRSDLHSITEAGEFIFSPITSYPDISDKAPELSFDVQKFCVLCSVYKPHSSQRLERQSSSSDSTAHLGHRLKRQMALGDTPAYVSPQTSHEDEDTMEGSNSSQPQFRHSLSYDGSSCSSFDENLCTSSTEVLYSPRKQQKSTKRKQPYNVESEHRGKRLNQIRYMLLLFEPESDVAPVTACIFACQDCSISIEVGKIHVHNMLLTLGVHAQRGLW